MPPGMDPMLARRYGLGRPQAQAPVAIATAPVNRPGEVVLDEKPLRVTLGLELVGLLPAKEKEKGRGKGADSENSAPTAAAQNQ